jgi:hypothetical protein
MNWKGYNRLEPLALDVAGAVYKYAAYLDIFCICLKIELFRPGQLLFNWIPCRNSLYI